MSDVEQLDRARRQLGLSVYDLWIAYIGVGGYRDAFDVRSYLRGDATLDDRDHDHLVLALNEAFDDAGADHPLPYRSGGFGSLG